MCSTARDRWRRRFLLRRLLRSLDTSVSFRCLEESPNEISVGLNKGLRDTIVLVQFGGKLSP